ncbi:ATP-grasp domain-containing protein [Candidatus Leptofilum sp.]|uniref:ATP-grasp domain-containing protein n=1 Tax=Candidatus Leptofilum sp. TaxID=3241576 RepID=UPI003B5BA99D
MSQNRPITILAIASECKGIPYLLEAKRQGTRVLLLVSEEAAQVPDWPLDVIEERFIMPDLSKQPDVTYAVSYLARTEKIDRIVALDDYDVATAASLREHLRIPGMGETTARHFRDKLAMRVRARDEGVLVPEFTAVFNNDDLNEFLQRVPPPWVLKPRFEAGAIGIRKLHEADAVWQAVNELGDQRSFYLLERFVVGNVCHVDSLIWENGVVFAVASQYGTPPLAVTTGGGIFNTRTLERNSESNLALIAANENLMRVLRQVRGVAHTEFIQAEADGRFYFLETAARVGGANIDRLVEAATGVVLWQEVARIDLASVRREDYQPPTPRQDYAGLIICLAQQEQPDLSAYDDPEIVWRLPKKYHAGLLVAGADYGRIQQLIHSYNERFARDFLTSAPPKSQVRTQI